MAFWIHQKDKTEPRLSTSSGIDISQRRRLVAMTLDFTDVNVGQAVGLP